MERILTVAMVLLLATFACGTCVAEECGGCSPPPPDDGSQPPEEPPCTDCEECPPEEPPPPSPDPVYVSFDKRDSRGWQKAREQAKNRKAMQQAIAAPTQEHLRTARGVKCLSILNGTLQQELSRDQTAQPTPCSCSSAAKQ
jgi:hypothetical protein